ncbi:nuclear transport factor 2 family protein [soil metagenome]
MSETPAPLRAWHEIAQSCDPAGLDVLLADDCVFRSPAVHTPQEGRAVSAAYLSAALVVLGPTLTYRHEWWDEASAVLEFSAEVAGLAVHGVDLLRWDETGRLVEFTVMVRPFQGLTALIEAMAEQLRAR